jgi:hypothetical protein
LLQYMRSIDDRTNRRLIITLLEEYFNTAVVSEPFERFFGETVLTHMRTLSVSEEHWNRVMETLTTETTLVAAADPEVTAALEATAAPEATAGAVPAEVVRPGLLSQGVLLGARMGRLLNVICLVNFSNG